MVITRRHGWHQDRLLLSSLRDDCCPLKEQQEIDNKNEQGRGPSCEVKDSRAERRKAGRTQCR